MNFRDIIVHIDNRPTCTSRLETAVRLAEQQRARLTGLYLSPHPGYLPHNSDREALTASARETFDVAVAGTGLDSEWLCVDGLSSGLDVAHALNLHAHYHDLVVVSQNDERCHDRSIPRDLPERAVLGSGRPVLIVPYAGAYQVLGRRMMLAWRGGPESSRAVHDAMPLLRQAEAVRVVTVQGPGGDEFYSAHNADICRHLERYGIVAASDKFNSAGLSVGDLLLNRCADEGIDLLVMGAFSQSRRGHQTLGEVGRHLLGCMTLPVLMSH